MEKVRQEKRRLDYKAPDFTITDVDLTVQLDMQATVVTAKSLVQRVTTDKSLPLVLDGDELKLLSVQVNGQNYAYQETKTSLTLANVPDSFELTVVTEISPAKNLALMGLYVSDGKFCTQCEPEGFRRITFFLDRSDVLARYTTHIVAPNGAYPFMLSNGNCLSDEVHDGIRTVTWQDPFPKPSYLFALVAGDFDELQDVFTTKSGKQVDVRLYVDKGQRQRGTIALASILKAMKWDETRFNLEYDLQRFMVVAVDFFNAGAMENKGLNIFNSKFVLADAKSATDTDIENILSVIGHEYFHNWTGDRVTCRDWFQLSLKEGLTVFRDQEFSSDLGCRPIERIKAVKVIRGPQFAEDAGPMAHPIRPDYVMEMNNFYSVTVYDKGAEVIRMIHTILGEQNFQAGMQLYFKRHDGKAVTCEDFIKAMEDASHIDLQQFRNWYCQSGTPVVTASMLYDDKEQTVTLSLHQNTPATPNQAHKKPFVIPLNMAFYGTDGTNISLQRNGETLPNVQLLTKADEVWKFDNVPQKPVIALLQSFSAPVKVEYPYTQQDLLTLLKYADDDFTKFDAMQSLINNYIVINTENIQRSLPVTHPDAICEAYSFILDTDKMDNRMKAFILTLPSISTLMELFTVVDLDALGKAYHSLFNTLSSSLLDKFANLYQSVQTITEQRIKAQAPYVCDDEQMGIRAVAKVTLDFYANGLLLANKQGEANSLVLQHYQLADNMTDTLTAMNIACTLGLSVADQILADFEAKWQDNPLVFDNYFRAVSLAPLPDTLTKVQALMKHKCFDMDNPNRVRALIGSFVAGNPLCFNALDGSGYRFMTEILTRLNGTNPHVAARIMTPMISLKRFDVKRRAMITECFKQLLQLPDLSDSIFEKIDKALKQ